MGCYTNLNWFSRRISDINNMPPKKERSFLRFPNHRFQQFGCVKCVVFVGFFLRFLRFLCGNSLPETKHFPTWKNGWRRMEDFFRFPFWETRLPGRYLNPTPRRPIQATRGLSQITLAMPNEAVNPVPFEEEKGWVQVTSLKRSEDLIWYQCHVSINIAPAFVMVFVCILAVYVYNYNMYPTTWKQWGWSLLWVLFHFQKISQTYPSFRRYKSKPTWGPMNCTKSAWRMFFWSIHW